MLEQSHVAIAGVVFNGLSEDINNWSSYGYEPLSFSSGGLDSLANEREELARSRLTVNKSARAGIRLRAFLRNLSS